MVIGSTLINTNQGILPINLLNIITDDNLTYSLYSKEVHINYQVNSFNINNLKLNRAAVRLLNYGKLPIISINTEYNYTLSGSYDHKIKVYENNQYIWKKLQDIKENDLVVIIADSIAESTLNLINQKYIDKLIEYDISDIDNIDRILESSKEIQKYFLQQYINKYMKFEGDKIYLQANKNIINQLQNLLLTFNIISNKFTDFLYIKNQYFCAIKNNIGLIDEQKITYINNMSSDNQIDNIKHLKVSSIRHLSEEQDVYSLIVDNTDNYIGNGFINYV